MLRELQRRFFAGLFDADSGLALKDLIAVPDEGSARAAIAIYRDSVLGGLSKALAEIYPVCRALVGARFFQAMSTRYALQTPSQCPDLDGYGADFARFIAGFGPAAELPYLPDVASLEWAWHRAFIAPDAGPLDLEALARVGAQDRGRILFRLPEGAALVASDYPIHRIWEVNQQDHEGDGIVDLDQGGVRLLVWREGLAMHLDPVSEGQWRMLMQIRRGVALGGLCSRLPAQCAGFDLTTALAEAARRGWFASFELAASFSSPS
jgi:hypothetical protein